MTKTLNPLVDPLAPTEKTTLRRRFLHFCHIHDELTFCTALAGFVAATTTGMLSLVNPELLFAAVPLSLTTAPLMLACISAQSSNYARNALTPLASYLHTKHSVQLPLQDLESNLPTSCLPPASQEAIRKQVATLLQAGLKQLELSYDLPPHKAAPYKEQAEVSLKKVADISTHVENLANQQKELLESQKQEQAQVQRETLALSRLPEIDQTTAELHSVAPQVDDTIHLLAATASARAELLPPTSSLES